MVYFEDIAQDGSWLSQEMFELTAEDIKAFARQWDPFPIHLDEAAAAKTPAGRLSAAGAQLLSIAIRLSHTAPMPKFAVIAAGGWDQVRFHRPGLLGDRLRVRLTLGERRRSSKRPDRGVLGLDVELFNQRGETVVSFINQLVVQARSDGA
ncbi:dehydratase [Denitratisoma sp. DHT3]|uniref:MaoC/PaaZ C-terminal domain-containing protein n=1 Tax=Denitratisoma sp. DHT3 TaxID=1981880 RepID=UPI0011987A2E|nr:MaoC/PaaZ C-terminal domain-containing protein [Denitratisoma sp. DHT3]QDX81846.1 dehydratase [Denitratisoma sp. DHT3]